MNYRVFLSKLWHNHKKPTHNKAVYIFYGAYCGNVNGHITKTSQGIHNVSNHKQFDYLFKILFRITTTQNDWPLYSESSGDRWITLTKASNANSVSTVMTPLSNRNKQGTTKPWISSWDVLYQRALQWHHNGRNSVSNHQPHYCLPNRLFRRRSKKTSKLRVTGLCAENWPVTGKFPAQWPVTRKMFPFDDVIIGCPCPYIQASNMGRQQRPEAMDRCLQSLIK